MNKFFNKDNHWVPDATCPIPKPNDGKIFANVVFESPVNWLILTYLIPSFE